MSGWEPDPRGTIKKDGKMRKVKCTNCGYEFEKNVENLYEGGKTPLFKMLTPATIPIKRKKCVDISCPKCKEEFEFCWEE